MIVRDDDDDDNDDNEDSQSPHHLSRDDAYLEKLHSL
jgi:hypothetical protein